MVDKVKLGKFSRMKGRRGEQQLVLALALLGYKAERVLRQYQASGLPDVIATKDGLPCSFEIKCRKNSFKALYDLYNAEKDENGRLAFALSSLSTILLMSTRLEAIEPIPVVVFRNLATNPFNDKRKYKSAARLIKLKELKQVADFLVLKDNNKPRLYIRYW